MPAIKTTVNLEVDDAPLASFPLVRRSEPTQEQSFDFQQTTGVAFTALPITKLTTLQVIALTCDQPFAVRWNGVAGEVSYSAAAVVVMHDAAFTVAPTLQNNSGTTARVRGFAFGV